MCCSLNTKHHAARRQGRPAFRSRSARASSEFSDSLGAPRHAERGTHRRRELERAGPRGEPSHEFFRSGLTFDICSDRNAIILLNRVSVVSSERCPMSGRRKSRTAMGSFATHSSEGTPSLAGFKPAIRRASDDAYASQSSPSQLFISPPSGRWAISCRPRLRPLGAPRQSVPSLVSHRRPFAGLLLPLGLRRAACSAHHLARLRSSLRGSSRAAWARQIGPSR